MYPAGVYPQVGKPHFILTFFGLDAAMAKHWARILMGLIFVFTTISSPLHAKAMSATSHPVPGADRPPVSMSMAGMGDACAKAMMVEAAKAKPRKPATTDPSCGCCANGCNCPLSHCPATPPLSAAMVPAPVFDGITVEADPVSRTPVSFHTETLIRPPRA